MLLEVRREPSPQSCTPGTLYIDGQFECFTLEDVVREVPQEAVEKWKVAGETAIPSGIYEVIVTMSAHFGKLLPLLLNVPGFEGVRIHSGNVAADTEGCILVGNRRASAAVLGSRIAFRALFAKIQAALGRNESVHIRISNPPIAQPADKVSLA
jgi:hypothetical protein